MSGIGRTNCREVIMFFLQTARPVYRATRAPRAALSLNRAFDTFFDSAFADAGTQRSRFAAVDVCETDAAYTLSVDLSGFAKEEVQVSIDERRVDVRAQSAEKPAESAQDGQRVLYRERSATSFSRSFELPVDIDAQASSAKLENGVLTITLTKKPVPAAVKLAVN